METVKTGGSCPQGRLPQQRCSSELFFIINIHPPPPNLEIWHETVFNVSSSQCPGFPSHMLLLVHAWWSSDDSEDPWTLHLDTVLENKTCLSCFLFLRSFPVLVRQCCRVRSGFPGINESLLPLGLKCHHLPGDPQRHLRLPPFHPHPWNIRMQARTKQPQSSASFVCIMHCYAWQIFVSEDIECI